MPRSNMSNKGLENLKNIVNRSPDRKKFRNMVRPKDCLSSLL